MLQTITQDLARSGFLSLRDAHSKVKDDECGAIVENSSTATA